MAIAFLIIINIFFFCYNFPEKKNSLLNSFLSSILTYSLNQLTGIDYPVDEKSCHVISKTYPIYFLFQNICFSIYLS